MNGQNILITGTNSGFGHLAARTLLAAGHTVHATMRDAGGRNAAAAARLADFAGGVPGTLHVHEMDVTDEASVAAAAAAAGDLDVVVNNAGAGAGGLAEAFTPAAYQRFFDINVMGPQRVLRAALPSMRARGRGLAINVSSIMGKVIIPFAGPYTVSKWALEGLVENYRVELLGTGVEMVSLQPGGFPTGIGGRMAGPDDEARTATYGELAGRPEQVWGPFMALLDSAEAPDPQLVADRIAELVAMAPGTRPPHVVVDPLTGGGGADQVNAAGAAAQAQLNKAFGLAP